MSRPDLARFKRLARVVRIIILVTFWVSVVAAGLSGLSALALEFLPDDLFFYSRDGGTMWFTIDGMVKFRLDSPGVAEVNVKPVLSTILLILPLVLAMLAVILHQLAGILRTVEEDRPFAVENASRLYIMGAVLVAGSFLWRLAQLVVVYQAITALRISDDVILTYTVDPSMLLGGFLLQILGGVFRYGNYLQQEYDATV